MESKVLFQQFLNKIQAIYPERESRNIMQIVFEDAFQININDNINLNDFQIQKLEKIVQRLLHNEPVQYITGIADFYGLKLKVTPDVLIPRAETEELVFEIIQDWKNRKEPFSILDIGTGSGCIPLVLKQKMPLAQVTSVDISEKALKIAAENAQLLSLDIDFKQIDILTLNQSELLGKFDLIVSNPPYITLEEAKIMPQNVLQYEPHLALFTIDDDGMIFYEIIGDFALKHLTDYGKLYFECNQYNASSVKERLIKKGFKNVILLKDMSGNDRIIKCNK